jgi:hypothetical protein
MELRATYACDPTWADSVECNGLSPLPDELMDHFIARENVNHFRDRLRSEADPTARSTLQKLLVEEEDKLAKDLSLLDDLAREIAKCRQWIEKQRLRIEGLERDGHDLTAVIALLNGVTETLMIHQEYRQRVATRLEQNT